ncbi:hypothetical protein LTR17_006371 [Elasticomyces elasticus]|nr:hypothetical protein LTR17_006371 [Elasticomyces elasticus]
MITNFVLLLSTGVTAISPTASTTLEHNSPTPQTVLWADCSITYGPGFTCTNYSVPVDWRSPSGEHIVLGMNRYQSNATSRNGKKKKNLFINYGGPGIIATQTLPLTLIGFSADITSEFDLNRGRRLPHRTSQPSFRTQLLGEKRDAARHHMDTQSVARDFEAIRIALGDEPMNFLGLSYGSQIVYQYAQLFPHNIRTMVGDGILDHSESETSVLASEAQTYEDSFNRFAVWAGTSEESALFGHDVAVLIDRLVDKANHYPIPMGSGPGHFDDITGDELLFNLQDVLISQTAGVGPRGMACRSRSWPWLLQAMAQVLRV